MPWLNLSNRIDAKDNCLNFWIQAGQVKIRYYLEKLYKLQNPMAGWRGLTVATAMHISSYVLAGFED
jgi:hypothetical protein